MISGASGLQNRCDWRKWVASITTLCAANNNDKNKNFIDVTIIGSDACSCSTCSNIVGTRNRRDCTAHTAL